jgi:hypothetical protein
MAYSTISKPGLHFNTLTYGGNDASGRAITGVGFQPDWCWFKDRSNATSHSLFDAVRTATKNIVTNTTAAESTSAQGLQAFGADGFTLGSDGDVNGNNNNYVSWNWKANGTGSSNTDGSINTTATSVNTTAGFSIVSYTGTGSSGATIGHGLGVAPNLIIARRRDGVEDWAVYHKTLGATKYLHINNNAAEQTNANRWNDTTPSATLITLGNHDSINYNGGTHIAYCFAEKKGYSKVGGYTGNGNSNGVFVYTGFKPAYIVLKRTNATENWGVFDNRLRPSNSVGEKYLYPDLNNAEDSSDGLDFYSNGFKIRTASNFMNGGGASYIYWAFAAEPLVANVGASVPATAR